jgi:AcrR family transcriptional regulator
VTGNEQLRSRIAVADVASGEAAHADTEHAGRDGGQPGNPAGHDTRHEAGHDTRPEASHDPRREAGQDPRHGAGHDPHHDARRSDTRARIQQVALELFAEQGYDKTSLREIAERLDVTKAALYYHFKSKEDIVRSLAEDYFGQIDAVIAWAKTQPRTAATRAEVLNRYVKIVAEGSGVFRMLQHNQAAMNSLADKQKRGEVFKERMVGLSEALTEPGAGMQQRLRATMALGAVSVGWMFFADQVKDRQKLCSAVFSIASELAEPPEDGQPA